MSKSIATKKIITIKQAIASFLLSCKVEGKSYGTIECYTDKLKGFLWYATNYHWPDDITAMPRIASTQSSSLGTTWFKIWEPNYTGIRVNRGSRVNRVNKKTRGYIKTKHTLFY